MKKFILLSMSLIFALKSYGLINGSAEIYPGPTWTYTLTTNPPPDINSVVWSSSEPGNIIISNVTYNTADVKIVHYNDYAPCSFTLTVKWKVNGSQSSETKVIARHPYIIGPQFVYPGENSTYTVVDPCRVNLLTHSFDWTAPNSSNSAAVLNYNNNNVGIVWPASNGPFTVSCDYLAGLSYGYILPPFTSTMKLKKPIISGPSGISLCDKNPKIFTVAPVVGAASYIWTLPIGWTGSSTTNSITVIPNGINGGVISVKALAASGSTILASDIGTFSIGINSDPLNFVYPSPTSVCATSQPSAVYQVNLVPNVTNYYWSYPQGWTGPAITTSNNVSVQFNGTSLLPGVITCTARLNCNSFSKTTSIAVTSVTSPTYNVTVDNSSLGEATYTFCTNLGSNMQFSTNNLNWNTQSQCFDVNLAYPHYRNYYIRAINSCGPSPSQFYHMDVPNPGTSRVLSKLGEEDQMEGEQKIVQLYPNPSSGIAYVKFPNDEKKSYSVQIFNEIGQLLLTENWDQTVGIKGDLELDLNMLPDGIYSVLITSNGEFFQNAMIVIGK